MSEAQLDLEKLEIVARPRPHWEAMDLGVLIARRWYGLLLASWLCIALPVFALSWLLIPEHPIWAILIVWWLKPVYERVPLRILSTAIFGATPTLGQALRGAGRAIWPGILRMLTYRRLSPNRSFEAPVWVLEQASASVRSKRFAVLQARAGSGAFWLTVLGVHVEAFLAMGLVTGVYLFIPANMEVDWWGMILSGSDGQQDWLVNLLMLAVMAAVAPIYVACGFALYLNRRVELEAWDLELGFRRLAQRAGALVLLLAVAGVGDGLAAPAADRDWYGPDPAMEQLSFGRAESREVIYSVLEGEDFNQQRTVKYPKFLRDWFEREAAQDAASGDGSMSVLIEGIARVAELVLWAGVALLIIWIVHRARLLDVVRGARRNATGDPPRQVLGMDVREGILPDDIGASASRLWEGGAEREALGLIYRAALGSLVHRFACNLKEADTEGDCLVKARAVLPDRAARYFARLTRTWQLAAYGHALPSESAFARLCREFDSAFVEVQGE